MSNETQVTTLRLEVDLLDELDEEQDERGYSNRTEYVRDILHRREEIGWGGGSGSASEAEVEAEPEPAPAPVEGVRPEGAGAGYDELLDRIDELQRMLQIALARDAPELEKRWQAGDADTVEVQEEVHPDSIRPHIENIDDPRIPGGGPTLDARKQAFADIYRRLYHEGRMTAAELKQEFFNEDLRYDDAYSWWTNCVHGRLDQLPGIRSPVEGGHYWFYDPEGVRWNREKDARPAQGIASKS